jgi:hypothetical protein
MVATSPIRVAPTWESVKYKTNTVRCVRTQWAMRVHGYPTTKRWSSAWKRSTCESRSLASAWAGGQNRVWWVGCMHRERGQDKLEGRRESETQNRRVKNAAERRIHEIRSAREARPPGYSIRRVGADPLPESIRARPRTSSAYNESKTAKEVGSTSEAGQPPR